MFIIIISTSIQIIRIAVFTVKRILFVRFVGGEIATGSPRQQRGKPGAVYVNVRQSWSYLTGMLMFHI